jgi:branched-chain amino acid transport system substrate-binding protein
LNYLTFCKNGHHLFATRLNNKIRDFDPGIQSGPMTFTPGDHAGIKRGKMVTIIKGKTVVLSEYPAPRLSP